MLGWKIISEGEYRINMPRLSKAESEIVLRICEKEKTDSKGFDKLLREYCEEEKIYLDVKQRRYLSEYARLHSYGFAFLEALLLDPEIEEISIIGPNRPAYVYVRTKGWQSVNAMFENSDEIQRTINKLAQKMGRQITLQNPRLDAILPDGSRMHASLPPVSEGEITIRKFRSEPFSPKELVNRGVISIEDLALVSLIMQADSSILVAGNTGSGKTTTLNALFSFVPKKERILLVEQTPEINVPHKQQIRLVSNENLGISLKDLIYDSLRMRPDRTVVGEIRNRTEVEAFFEVLLSGQARGCYATLHAQGVNELVSRLNSMGIPKQDIDNIDLVIIQRRMLVFKGEKKEVRKIVEITDGFGVPIRKSSRIKNKIAEYFDKDAIKDRKSMLKDAPEKFDKFFEAVQGRL